MLIYIIIPYLTSCAGKNYENSGAAWGTTYHIVYTAPRELGDSIVAVMAQVEDELSMFKPTSTVSRINRGEDIAVGEMFREVFTLSQEISRLSGGAFDPTVGPLTNLWGFGTKSPDSLSTPSDSLIAEVLQAVGIADCRLEGDRIVKKHPMTVFDFSSVAKGYGVDAVAAMLTRNGATDYLVEIGGETRTSGLNAKGRPWRIQIDAPTSGDAGHERLLVISPGDRAVASSGNYRNYRDTPEGRIGHTINPATGRPSVTSTAATTVIAPDCATADALATACMVMQPDSAIAMIELLPDTEAMIIIAAPRGPPPQANDTGGPGGDCGLG